MTHQQTAKVAAVSNGFLLLAARNRANGPGLRDSSGVSQSTYDTLAPVYDAVAAPFEWPMVRRGLALLEAKQGERVLEVGHGTGRALEVLATAVGPGGKVVGLDLSSGMARVAAARLARAGLSDRV